MITRLLSILVLLAFMVTAPLATREQSEAKGNGAATATCALAIELTDAANGEVLPGMISVRDEAGKRVSIFELLPRGIGVSEEFAIHDWHVLPGPAIILRLASTARRP